MCGIIGYIGSRDAAPIVLDGLKRLEYRGYDSAGVALCGGKDTHIIKKQGRVDGLVKEVNKAAPQGTTAISHTRWATHGSPTDENAHPHHDCSKKIFVVHNGIVENYSELKDYLIDQGHYFISETDTEVIPHLIENILNKSKSITFEEAVRRAFKLIKGAYAVVAFHSDNPNKLVIARQSSPLLIGVGDGEYFVSSDASAIIAHTRKVVYMNDGEFAVITPKDLRVANLDKDPIDKDISTIDFDSDSAKKKGYPHFMLKEIYEEPEAVENALRGRMIPKEGLVPLGGFKEVDDRIAEVERLIITGCGTAYLAGLVGEYMIEEYAGIPTEVDIASELRYRKPVFGIKDAFLTVSQSGETADTLAALKEAKRKGLLTLGITNVVGSTIARTTDAGIYNHAGPEIGVASTKAFVSQLSVFALLATYLGRQRDMSLTMGRRILEELGDIPGKMQDIFKKSKDIEGLAHKYKNYDNFFYIGRKYNLPIAYEGALKLKEISYVHAEGYGSGELKHGPLALIDKDHPTVVIAPRDSVYEKNVSNIEEIKARGGRVLAIATEGDDQIKNIVDDVIYIPKTLEMLTPLLSVVPLHFLAYYIGVMRGCDVDKPRNLAKSVTVE